MLVLTYQYTSDSMRQSRNLMQGMLLISIVAATIMQAIGDSIARGLGILGALAIIRFRTTVREPRNLTFIFASIAMGIACGVYGFLIAIIGTIAFCSTAIILKFSYFSRPKELIGSLNIDLALGSDSKNEIEIFLKKMCIGFELVEINHPRLKEVQEIKDAAEQPKLKSPDRQELTYKIILKQDVDTHIITDIIYKMQEVSEVKLRFEQIADDI